MSSIKQETAFIILIAAVLLGSFAFGTIGSGPHPGMDLEYYRAIAEASPAITAEVPQPFAYRLLGPYVVGLLPVNDATGFYVVNLLLAIALALLFFRLLAYSRVDVFAALITTLLYVLNWFLFAYNLWNIYQLDDLISLVAIVMAVRALWDSHWFTFSTALTLGVLARETPMIMIPVGAVYLLERKRWKAESARFAAAILPPIAAFVVLRLFIQPSGGLGLMEALSMNSSKFTDPVALFNLLIRPFTPLVLLPLLFVPQIREYLAQRKYLIALFFLVFLSSMFGSDNERLMAPAFVVFYFVIAQIVESHLKDSPGLLIFVVICVALRCFHRIVTTDSPDYDMWERWIMITTTVAVPGAIYLRERITAVAQR